MYIFRGTKEVSRQSIIDQLGLAAAPAGMQRAAAGAAAAPAARDGVPPASVSRFLLPAQECEFTLATVLEELQRDAFPVPSDQRPARCTGVALSVAAGLLGACVPGTGARILSFIGGPCTEGPGTVSGGLPGGGAVGVRAC